MNHLLPVLCRRIVEEINDCGSPRMEAAMLVSSMSDAVGRGTCSRQQAGGTSRGEAAGVL